MGWRHPERKLTDGAPVDVFDFNEALRPVVEEVQGMLDEHNFTEGMASELDPESDLPADVPYRWSHARVTQPDIWDYPNEGDSDAGPNVKDHPFTKAWRGVGVSTDLTLTEAGQVLVVGGCQWWFDRASNRYNVIDEVTQFDNRVHLRWAISVNGQVYPDLIWGSQDFGEEGRGREAGYYGISGAPLVEGIVPLPAGVHTFKLVYQTNSLNPQPSSNIFAAHICTGNVELVAISLER